MFSEARKPLDKTASPQTPGKLITLGKQNCLQAALPSYGAPASQAAPNCTNEPQSDAEGFSGLPDRVGASLSALVKSSTMQLTIKNRLLAQAARSFSLDMLHDLKRITDRKSLNKPSETSLTS